MGYDDVLLGCYFICQDFDKVLMDILVLVVYIFGYFSVMNIVGLKVVGIIFEMLDFEGGKIRCEGDGKIFNGVLEEFVSIFYVVVIFNLIRQDDKDYFLMCGLELVKCYGYIIVVEG